MNTRLNEKVVCLGGGHGLAATLSCHAQCDKDVTAIVTVADNGGSSGRLREEFNSLPPGDFEWHLLLCVVMMNGEEVGLRLCSIDLQVNGPMDNHAIGNLLLTALWDRDGDPVKGLARVGDLLQVVGRVLPMALEPLDIEATLEESSEQKN
jgi:uncharacterized cofD-like protein